VHGIRLVVLQLQKCNHREFPGQSCDRDALLLAFRQASLDCSAIAASTGVNDIPGHDYVVAIGLKLFLLGNILLGIHINADLPFRSVSQIFLDLNLDGLRIPNEVDLSGRTVYTDDSEYGTSARINAAGRAD